MGIDTAISPDQCSAILIAGGRSRRMGRPKAALPIGGMSMLEHVASRVAPLVREIVVVAAADQHLPTTGARVIRDRVRDEGPLPALALGLGAVATPWAFALGCDTPLVRRAVLGALLAEHEGATAVVPRWDGRLQPLVALYHRALAPGIEALVARDERRMQAVANLPGVRIVEAERLAPLDPEGWSFRSLNTPDAYADALRHLPRAAADE